MLQKYKVFIRNKPVVFSIFHWFTGSLVTDEQIYKCTNELITNEIINKSTIRLIKAAGGIVRNHENKILCIFRKNVWDLPKGKVDKFETLRHAAKREVKEECGINGLKIIKQLPSTFHMYFLDDNNSKIVDRTTINYKPSTNLVIKKTYWYEMYYDMQDIPKPQLSENITEIRWFDVNEINEVLQNTYKTIHELFSTYLQT